ncbi:MAG: hypothetical protein CMB80_01005 [Flammeovirgaceae bacterium]|nr:hypothetical protein [Flammeovirgaceae bacterium]
MATATKTSTVTTVPVTVVPAQQVVTGQTLASILKDKGGASSFISFEAVYSMDDKGKMLVKDKAKNPNPYKGQGVVKIAKTQATVNWASSEEKTLKRGGEWSGKGTWHQVVLIEGKVTPICVHKADIETELPDELSDSLNNRKAVVNEHGSLNYTAKNPRFYLRYEVVRKPGDGVRAERSMSSESEYFDAEDNIVPKEDIEPFLPVKTRKDETDIQVTALGNLRNLKIDGVQFNII